RGYDEGDWSDESAVSSDSRPLHRHHRNDGGHGNGLFGGRRRLEIP
ncbi:hypothetical protein A2U01_0117580, partial [Trifolium medium]|nr:hypothetical protein [Trifolium medium]